MWDLWWCRIRVRFGSLIWFCKFAERRFDADFDLMHTGCICNYLGGSYPLEGSSGWLVSLLLSFPPQELVAEKERNGLVTTKLRERINALEKEHGTFQSKIHVSYQESQQMKMKVNALPKLLELCSCTSRWVLRNLCKTLGSFLIYGKFSQVTFAVCKAQCWPGSCSLI